MPTPPTPRCTHLAPEYAEAGLPVQSYTPAVHPEDRDRIRDISLAAMEKGGDFSDEYRLIQADGSVRWVYTRGSCYLDADGQPARNAGVVLDITERKTVEAALHAAQADLDLAVEAARMGRWDHNPDAGKRFWDARARAIFGLGRRCREHHETYRCAWSIPRTGPVCQAAVSRRWTPRATARSITNTASSAAQ
jgi:PAS domain-containing protein